MMDLLGDAQMRFRRGKSYENPIFNLSTVLQHWLSENKDTFVPFIDMTKAFDSVNRDFFVP